MELLKLKDLKQCPNCNFEMGYEFKFCPNCGIKQQEKAEENDQEGIKDDKQ